jgi:hypothetical protein
MARRQNKGYAVNSRKASHLKKVERLKKTSLKMTRFEQESFWSMVAKVIEIEHRLIAVEEKAGIAGPKGEKGAQGETGPRGKAGAWLPSWLS